VQVEMLPRQRKQHNLLLQHEKLENVLPWQGKWEGRLSQSEVVNL
jgi:hypothetical protein